MSFIINLNLYYKYILDSCIYYRQIDRTVDDSIFSIQPGFICFMHLNYGTVPKLELTSSCNWNGHCKLYWSQNKIVIRVLEPQCLLSLLKLLYYTNLENRRTLSSKFGIELNITTENMYSFWLGLKLDRLNLEFFPMERTFFLIIYT